MNYNKSVWVDVFSEKDFRRYRKGRIVAKLINIGFGNVVNSDKIVAVVSPEAAPVKRMVPVSYTHLTLPTTSRV